MGALVTAAWVMCAIVAGAPGYIWSSSYRHFGIGSARRNVALVVGADFVHHFVAGESCDNGGVS
jgi:hypothetical protein